MELIYGKYRTSISRNIDALRMLYFKYQNSIFKLFLFWKPKLLLEYNDCYLNQSCVTISSAVPEVGICNLIL